MTCELILVLNGKGGVGKSFFATNLVSYFRERGDGCLAIDTDNENSTLARFHPDAEFISIEQPRCIDRIFAQWENHHRLIVDGRAASTDILLRYFAELDLGEIQAATESTLTVCVPINHEADSIEQLRLLHQALPQTSRFVVIKNQSHSQAFQIYEQSQTRISLTNERNAIEIVMPTMHDWIVTLLNRHALCPSAAAQNPAIALLDRQRIRYWQQKFYAELERAFPAQSETTTASIRE